MNKTITIATQPWHNSTFLLMKMLGFVVMGYYFELESNYIEKIKVSLWLKFTVSLIIINSVKPSFFLGFAPTMLIFLIRDFIRNKGKTFRKQFIFGSAVLCSMPVLFLQLGVLYPNSSSSGSGIEITARFFLQHIQDGILIPSILTSLLFPILVSIVFIRKHEWNGFLSFGWLVFLLSFLQRLFMRETGPRAGDGNFGWGVRFFVILLFVICFQNVVSNRELFSKKWLAIVFTPLFLMIISAVAYYIIILSGSTYAI